jgi:hypothetical protein
VAELLNIATVLVLLLVVLAVATRGVFKQARGD